MAFGELQPLCGEAIMITFVKLVKSCNYKPKSFIELAPEHLNRSCALLQKLQQLSSKKKTFIPLSMQEHWHAALLTFSMQLETNRDRCIC